MLTRSDWVDAYVTVLERLLPRLPERDLYRATSALIARHTRGPWRRTNN